MLFQNRSLRRRPFRTFSFDDAGQSVLLELDVKFDPVVDLMLEKIRKDNVRLVAGRERVTSPGEKIFRLIQAESGAYAQAQGCPFLWMVVRIVPDL